MWRIFLIRGGRFAATAVALIPWRSHCRGLGPSYVKCLFTNITYAFRLAHNFCPLAFRDEMMMANGSTTAVLQAIPNLLTVIK